MQAVMTNVVVGILSSMGRELAVRMLGVLLAEARKAIMETETKTDDRLLLPFVELGEELVARFAEGKNEHGEFEA